MKYGLIGAGPVNQYLVSELPRLSQELGPVAASNRRSASRIANTLRAGTACNLDELDTTEYLLICAPDGHLTPLCDVLKRSKINWQGKCLVLCECPSFSRELDFFVSAGASVASLRRITGLPQRFLVEGDREALRAAKYLVQQLRGLAIEIAPEDYGLYRAAATLASSLFTPLLEGCMSAMRHAHVSGAHSSQIVEALFLDNLRAFLYSGRKSWKGTVAEADDAAMKTEIASLAAIRPELAGVYRSAADSARALLGPEIIPAVSSTGKA